MADPRHAGVPEVALYSAKRSSVRSFTALRSLRSPPELRQGALGAAGSEGSALLDPGRATSVAVYIYSNIYIYEECLYAAGARTHLSRPSPAPETGLEGKAVAIPEARVGQ